MPEITKQTSITLTMTELCRIIGDAHPELMPADGKYKVGYSLELEKDLYGKWDLDKITFTFEPKKPPSLQDLVT